MTWFRNWYVQWALAGFLLGSGFLWPLLWPLSVIGIAYILFRCAEEKTFRRKLLGVWLAWSIKAGMAVGWFWTTYPIAWLPVDVGQIQLLLIFFSWLMTAVTLGAGGLVLVMLVEMLKRWTDLPRVSYVVLVFPLGWLVAELAGALAFSAFFYGPGGTLNTWFGFGQVGYVLAHHELLLQLARLAGVFGLGYVAVLAAGVLASCTLQSKKNLSAIVSVAVLFYLLGTFPLLAKPVATSAGEWQVLTIDTQFDSAFARDKNNFDTQRVALEEVVTAALAEESDYVILPEDSRYFDQSKNASPLRDLFALQHGQSETIVVDSGRATHGDDTVLQAFIYTGPTTQPEQYHKRYLVPQGEYFSSLYTYILRMTGYAASYQYIAEGMSYRVGPWTSQATASERVPGILFCFESFAPLGVRTVMRERGEVPFVAHIASHAWFHEPESLWSQMDAMMRVQAVWNQEYLVSAGNMMGGRLYAPNGFIERGELIAQGDKWGIRQFRVPK